MKILLFFCDIEGTLTDCKKTPNYDMLFSDINEMKKLYECDISIFSLISMNEYDSVFMWYEKIKNNNNIIFGKQFYDNGYFEDVNGIIKIDEDIKDKSKLGYMKMYIEELSKNHEIKMLCYADDNLYDIYTDFFKGLLNKNNGIKLIKPSNNNKEYENDVIKTEDIGYTGLIEGLDTIIEKKKIKKRKTL